MVEDGLDEREIARPQELEIAVRDFGGGDILLTVCLQYLLGQMIEPAALVFMAPQAARGKQEIEMRERAQGKDLTVEDKPGLQEGHIESLAVESHHRTETHLGEKLPDLPDEMLFLGQVAEKELADLEAIVPEVPEADQKGDNSDSSREPGRLKVQEERRGKVKVGEAPVPAEKGEHLAADLETGRDGDLSIATVDVVVVLQNLERCPFLGLGTRDGRLFPRRGPGQSDQPLQFFLGGNAGLPLNLEPRPADCFRSVPRDALLLGSLRFIGIIHLRYRLIIIEYSGLLLKPWAQPALEFENE